MTMRLDIQVCHMHRVPRRADRRTAQVLVLARLGDDSQPTTRDAVSACDKQVTCCNGIGAISMTWMISNL